MLIYDIIYNFISTHFFSGSVDNDTFLLMSFNIGDNTITGADWLNHTLTIIIIVLILVMLINLIIWLFRLFGNFLGGK